jgi:uncharacterized surface protein with fasciclin (FAS1) repeats
MPIPARLLAIAAATVTAACSSSGAGTTMHHHMRTSPEASHSAGAAAAMIGSDCGMVPASGAGSMHSMAMQPLTAAAASNHLLAGYAAAVQHAGLAHELDARHGVTVFAPQTSAFMHLPTSEMGMMHRDGELAKIIKYTVVGHSVTPMDLAHGMSLTTLEGSAVTASKMGKVYEVGKAAVTCGPIHTENATVYITNKLLIPMH